MVETFKFLLIQDTLLYYNKYNIMSDLPLIFFTFVEDAANSYTYLHCRFETGPTPDKINVCTADVLMLC